MSKDIQPIFIMPEGTQRTTGKNAQRNNILAGKLISETVRTTLGPKGMDKMIVGSMGDVTVTNDGVTILQEMQIEHPAAKMIVEVAKTQEEEIGDGTTTAVVVAGELLKQAEELLEQNIHPTVIVRGYRQAAEKAQEILKSMAENVSSEDDEILKKIASTAICGKGAESAKEKLSELAVRAVKKVSDEEFNKDDIKLEKKTGGAIEDTELIEGIVIEKEIVHPGMPKQIKNCKIALIDSALEIKNTEIDAKISITDPSQMQAFLEQEEKMLQTMVDKVVKSGANVIFCQKGVDDMAQHFLAKKGIAVARRLKQSDMKAISRATGAKIVSNLDDLNEKDLGKAGTVEERKIGEDEMIFITECENPKSVTVLVRGGTEHIVDEAKRAMTDAIGDVAAALKVGKVVAGAGAPETELAKELRKYSESLSGREQLAVKAFAHAMEIIPKTLAENAGLDPIDILTEIKSKHEQGQKWAGVDAFTGKIIDSWEFGVIEPLNIKTQAISSASEVTQMILRIDDVIAGSKEAGPAGGMPAGMPPGMGM
ncbi:TCP-1/cpn60 chaperonin family protein [Candidatus Woesearchaeota archaeon]|nr:TCP-1/cpn60 chaperonin family protein [Candidatus Woesearchaeota archaeon]MBW2978948.1 TCP-1/cpn60 chaperonin family protein [Candidatus Woesearchaeota archaeon]